jgi:hypothetical protein
VKCRSKVWDPWFIQKIKYDSNMEIAKSKDKSFVFLTEVNKTVYLYNISKLTKLGREFKWTTKLLPNSTEFTKSGKEEKLVNYLYVREALLIHL